MPKKYYKNGFGTTFLSNYEILEDLNTLGNSPNGEYTLKFQEDKIIGNNRVFKLPFVPDTKRIHVYDNGNALIVIGKKEMRNSEYVGWINKCYLANINTGILTELKEGECFNYKQGTIMSEPAERTAQFIYKQTTPYQYGEAPSVTLQDPSYQHILISKLDVPYVLIDNHKTGNGSALETLYDEKSNSFIWISIENNSLVLYEYKL